MEQEKTNPYLLLYRRIFIFLIRPRRFVKSLFVDTIDKIAQGSLHKELFQHCAIYNQSFKKDSGEAFKYHWKKYPVIRLSFASLSKASGRELKQDLIDRLDKIARHYKITLSQDSSLSTKYINLVEYLTTLGNGYQDKIIVLIDEYDSPLVNIAVNATPSI